MNSRWHAAWLISGLLSFGVANAEPKQLTDQELSALAAKVDKADSLFKKEKFVEALEIYQEAYNLTEEPTMLFSIAQCQRNLDNNKEASDNYRKFLKSSPPDNELRPLAEQLLAETEAKIPKESPAGPTGSPEDPTPSASKKSRYFFIGAGAAGAASVGLGVSAVLAANTVKAQQAADGDEGVAQDFTQKSKTRALAADLSFVAAVGFGVGGFMLSKKEKGSAALLIGPSQVAISMEF